MTYAINTILENLQTALAGDGYNAYIGKYLDQITMPAFIITPLADRFVGEQYYPNRPEQTPLQCDVLITLAVSDGEDLWYEELNELLCEARRSLIKSLLVPTIGADQLDMGPARFSDPRAGGRLGVAEMILTITYRENLSST